MTDTPMDESALKGAEEPPRLAVIWERACWVAFWIGAGIIFLAVAYLGLRDLILPPEPSTPPAPHPMRVHIERFAPTMLMSVVLVAFGLAARNTYLAATGFGERAKIIKQYVDSHLDFLSPNDTTRGRSPNDNNALLIVYARVIGESISPSKTREIRARGAFQPEPYRHSDRLGYTAFPYREYVDLLDAEVSDARKAAAHVSPPRSARSPSWRCR